MFLKATRLTALDRFGHHEEAQALIDKVVEDYAEFGYSREIQGHRQLVLGDVQSALVSFADALKHYPAEANEHRSRTLLRIGDCHNLSGRPLAAWAAWKGAMRINPNLAVAGEEIEEYVARNNLLPRGAREGLTLRSPDELALFNEERRERWNAAIADQKNWDLDDLARVFGLLAEDDRNDAAAWYNLAVARAWRGDNAAALAALDHYVAIETDFELAADAWELGEILRLGVGMDQHGDIRNYVAVYEIPDPNQFLERLRPSRHVLVMKSSDGARSLHWMDREIAPNPGAVPLLGGPPRQIAQLNLALDGLEIVATTPEQLRAAQAGFDRAVGETARFVETYDRPGEISAIDAEPFLIAPEPGTPSERQAEMILESVQRYFETEWIRRPLKSLSGLAPIDAAQSPKFKAKLEGVIRFRERNFDRFNTGYRFDRLRNKLGLETHAPPEERAATDLTAYSGQQLAALEPASLSDEELMLAYHSALGSDVEETAARLGEEILRRETLLAQAEAASVFRRLIQQRLDNRELEGTLELIERAAQHARRHADAEGAGDWTFFKGRYHLAAGDKAGALAAYAELAEREPQRVDLLARAIEGLLSAGEYGAARQFAELGLERAQGSKHRDAREQMREYLAAARARAK